MKIEYKNNIRPIKKVRELCEICGEFHYLELREEDVVTTFQGKEIQFTKTCYFCNNTNEEYETPEMFKDNHLRKRIAWSEDRLIYSPNMHYLSAALVTMLIFKNTYEESPEAEFYKDAKNIMKNVFIEKIKGFKGEEKVSEATIKGILEEYGESYDEYIYDGLPEDKEILRLFHPAILSSKYNIDLFK